MLLSYSTTDDDMLNIYDVPAAIKTPIQHTVPTPQYYSTRHIAPTPQYYPTRHNVPEPAPEPAPDVRPGTRISSPDKYYQYFNQNVSILSQFRRQQLTSTWHPPGTFVPTRITINSRLKTAV